jgi:hypothetical protein
MRRPIPILLLAAAVGHAAAADDARALLQAADRYRTTAPNLRVETRVDVRHADGSTSKERLYTVFVQEGRRSLVLMRSPAESGQRVLMLGDDFWLLMPGSQRPLRITPVQKLLGDASVGDIATLSWADDYRGELRGTEDCGGRPCLHLSLQALRKGLSYQRIELWIGQARHEPLRAELYVMSDKLAKRARFVLDQAERPTQVDRMVLEDELGSAKTTHVHYLARQATTVPEAWLNPMFLARNPALE